MSCIQFNSRAPGVLDGRGFAPSPVHAKTEGVYTHNPYWYEGFNPLSLADVAPSYQTHNPYAGYRLEEQLPYPWSQYHWAERRVPSRPLRSLRMKYQEPVDYRRGIKSLASPQTSDSASDNTIGYSDSERSMSDRGSEEKDSRLEAQLVQCIVDYFGDCKGSLPSERVQNVIKKDFAELYEAVVVTRFRKKWHKFLQHCSDTFYLFTRPAQPAPNQDYCWRIRLASNPDWEDADAEDEEYRAKRDRELLDKVYSILSSSPNKQCLMIDVINEMNKEAKNEDGKEDSDNRKTRKIRAGDLKRLMRKCNSNFSIVEFQEEENQKRTTYMKLVDPAGEQAQAA